MVILDPINLMIKINQCAVIMLGEQASPKNSANRSYKVCRLMIKTL